MHRCVGVGEGVEIVGRVAETGVGVVVDVECSSDGGFSGSSGSGGAILGRWSGEAVRCCRICCRHVELL